ncbi:MAG TPA: hypothetical protein VLE53_15685, partial [Gemmatimonadaceae bacterium]|nr:hypothetical protein [Gemmatimonadaceae bacterium]
MARYPALSPLTMSVPAADGLVLRGHLVYPHGKTGARYPLAVLAHQYPAARESFAPLLADLHALGVATLAFDLRGHGESIWSSRGIQVAQTPAEPTMDAFVTAFTASASAVGFPHIADDIVRVSAWGLTQNFIESSRLLLVGASVGGTGVLLAAPRLREVLRGVLTFGAAGAGVHAADAMQVIRRNCETVRLPMLLTTSERDPFDGANNARTWGQGLGHVTTRLVAGADHAMGIYYVVRTEVLRFVRHTLGSPPARRLPVR